MWGHDFRPDYLFIRRALDALGRPAILGMTATATPATEREIAAALGREPEVVRTSVVRPNLRYDVEIVDGEEDRLRTLVRRLHELRGASAIVYARSRRSCETLARTLRVHDLAAVHYHAGLEPQERSAAQEAFIEGRIQTVVATTAFGMGIDKPDIRLVALYNYPESLESYVQMVGRAGRDGRASDTLLLASRSDASQLRRFARSDIPTVADLRAVYARLRGRREVLPEELGDEPDPRVLVGMLEQVGLVRARLRRRPGDADRGARPARRLGRRGSTGSSPATSGRRWPGPTGSSASPSRASAGTGRWPSTSARRSRRTAACATSARRSRRPSTRASRRRRCRTTSPARSTAPCSSCAGRSAAPASRRCCAAR